MLPKDSCRQASDAGLEVAGKNLEELGKKKANDQEMKSRVIYK